MKQSINSSWFLLLLMVVVVFAACGRADRSEPRSSTGTDEASPASVPRGEANSARAESSVRSKSSARREPSDASADTDTETHHQPEPSAGLLTAGEWRDLEHWNFWKGLMERDEPSQLASLWGFNSEKRGQVLVRDNGSPVVDATVTLKDNTGEILWVARTDNRGQAEVFAGLFDRSSQQNWQQSQQQGERQKERMLEYQIQIEADGKERTINAPQLDGQRPIRIELEQVALQARTLDLMFMIDATGSMGDELEYIKTELNDVIRRVEQKNGEDLEVRLSCNVYRDRGDAYVVRSFPFTTDIDQAISELESQRAEGGGDYPEAVDEALQEAIADHDWSRNATARLLFLVLDAPPHDEEKIKSRVRNMVEEAAEKGIRIIPIASSGVDKPTEFLMRFLSISTGGTYIFLTDDSGIGNSHIEPTIGKYDVEYLNNLLVRVIGNYVTHSRYSKGNPGDGTLR